MPQEHIYTDLTHKTVIDDKNETEEEFVYLPPKPVMREDDSDITENDNVYLKTDFHRYKRLDKTGSDSPIPIRSYDTKQVFCSTISMSNNVCTIT